MAADPGLDRIAAAIEEALSEADPRHQALMVTLGRRFTDGHLRVYRGDPAELGAVMLKLYSEVTAMSDLIGQAATLEALSFHLANAGTRLYLRRDSRDQQPDAHRAAHTARADTAGDALDGLYLTCGASGPWLLCRDCTGDDQIIGGFDDRAELSDILSAAALHTLSHDGPGR